MSRDEQLDRRFIAVALKNGLITQDKIDRALVIQKCVFNKAQVHTPIGDILIQMGAMTEAQKEQVLTAQKILEAGEANGQASSDSQEGDASEDKSKLRRKRAVGFDLTVSNDGLEAYIVPEFKDMTDVTIEDVKAYLQKKRIKFGIVDDNAIREYIGKSPLPPTPFKIAQGTAPVSPTSPELKYYFDTNPLRVGKEYEDGSIDWKDRGKLPQVKDGDLIAEIIPGKPGRAGRDVSGRFIPPPKPEKVRLKKGKGVDRSEDGLKFYARVGGMPKLSRDGKLHVLSTLRIDGDIGLETGHVEFDGHIEVNGIVQSGYHVKGASLRAKELYNAEFEISGDIVSLGGVYHAKIQSNGNLRASHIHNSDLIIFGDIVVEKEIFESRIETNGQLVIDNGIIISSKISAKKGIYARNIGTEASRRCNLDVGIDHWLEREINAIKEQIEARDALIEAREKEIAALNERSDYLNTQLGEIAQEQDGYMVKERQLEETLKRVRQAQDQDQIEAIENTIREFNAKRKEIDDIVASHLKEDEEILNRIPGLEAEVAVAKEEVESYHQAVKDLEEAAEQDPGFPVVKTSGTIIGGTMITGPNATLTTKENYLKVRIGETDKVEGSSKKKWRMKISNL